MTVPDLSNIVRFHEREDVPSGAHRRSEQGNPTAFKRWALESASGQSYQRWRGHLEYRLSDP